MGHHRHLALATLTAFGTAPAMAADPTPAALQALIDERAVIAIADDIDRAVDARDWARARGHFAERVRVDFSTLSGQPAANLAADELIAGWAGNLKGGKTSLHLRTNHAVTLSGERATVASSGYAWNRMEGNGDPLWEVWGTYEHRLVKTDGGWKVDGFTFRMTHERGNDWVKTTPGR